MKIFEKILIIIFVLTIILKAFNVNYSKFIFYASVVVLSLYYFPLGFITLINKKEQNHLLIQSFLFGYSLSFGLVSLFINIIFSGNETMPFINKIIFTLAVLFLILSLFVALFLYKRKNKQTLKDEKFYYFIIYRALVLIILLLLSYLPFYNL